MVNNHKVRIEPIYLFIYLLHSRAELHVASKCFKICLHTETLLEKLHQPLLADSAALWCKYHLKRIVIAPFSKKNMKVFIYFYCDSWCVIFPGRRAVAVCRPALLSIYLFLISLKLFDADKWEPRGRTRQPVAPQHRRHSCAISEASEPTPGAAYAISGVARSGESDSLRVWEETTDGRESRSVTFSETVKTQSVQSINELLNSRVLTQPSKDASEESPCFGNGV